MSHITPQTWQRNPLLQALQPLSARLMSLAGLVVPAVRKISTLRAQALARPLELPRNFRANLKTALLAGVFILLYRTIMSAGLLTMIPDAIDPQLLHAKVLSGQSGTATRLDQSLAPLKSPSPLVGDDGQDRQVKLFLSFDLRDLPLGARVQRAKLSFKCTLAGDISGYGDLSLHTVDFEGYSAGVFDSFPVDKNNFRARIFLAGNKPLLSGCNTGRDIAFSNEALAHMVASQTSAGKLNLVLYFEDASVLANGQADGIRIDSLPQLEVYYSR